MTNQSKPEKAGSIGFWKHVISKIWIESTGSRWSSSGKNVSRLTTLGILDEIQKMMTESKCEPEQFKGSSSCQCTMILIGQNEETKKIELRTLPELLSMLEESRMDIGHFQGLDPRRNGTEPVSTNLMENGRKLPKAWCSTLPKAVILYFVPAAPWKE